MTGPMFLPEVGSQFRRGPCLGGLESLSKEEGL